MKIEVCDVCRQEKDLVDYGKYRVCSECQDILMELGKKQYKEAEKYFSESQRCVAWVVSLIKNTDREKLIKYFGTSGIKYIDEIREEN